MIEEINAIANKPLFIGATMLFLNVGSRFITHELSQDEKEYQENILLRRLAVFAACFVGTRDIVISIILTAAFVVLAGGIFRGKGPFSREGMTNGPPTVSDLPLRAAAGLAGQVDHPAYSKEEKPMFR